MVAVRQEPSALEANLAANGASFICQRNNLIGLRVGRRVISAQNLGENCTGQR
jgi:hypothetical protein